MPGTLVACWLGLPVGPSLEKASSVSLDAMASYGMRACHTHSWGG